MFPKPNFLQRILALEPVLTRGVIVSIIGILGGVANHHFADGTVEYIGNVVIGGFAFLSAVATRPAVTPNAKVNTYSPQPFGNPDATKTMLEGRY